MTRVTQQYEKTSPIGQAAAFILTGLLVILLTPNFRASHYDSIPWLEGIIGNLRILLDHEFVIKLACLLLMYAGTSVRRGKKTNKTWFEIILRMAVALFMYLPPWRNELLVAVFYLAGITLFGTTIMLIKRKVGENAQTFDPRETFLQCDEKIENDTSVNIPTKYYHNGRVHNGWINIVAPQRASIVLGKPGCGKSYVFFYEFMRQLIMKGQPGMIYDFKFTDKYNLSRTAYNFLQFAKEKKKNNASFYLVNFNDVHYTHRINPLHPRYINSTADTAEMAKNIFANTKKGNNSSKDPFWDLSGELLINMSIYYLYKYRGGIYCDLPHVIMLMTSSYRDLLDLFKTEPELEAMNNTFAQLMKDKVYSTLMSQVASATIPMSQFINPELFYIMSGDEFDVRLNNPEDPKILCIGSSAYRQETNASSIALITSLVFKQINRPNQLKSFMLLDECPTATFVNLNTLIDTARSQGVSVVIGAQDLSQFEQRYSKEVAENLFNTPNNLFTGSVGGKTAEQLSKAFGREKRMRMSTTDSIDSESYNYSYQEEDRLPIQRVNNMATGEFFGWTADTGTERIENKQFCAMCQIDKKQRKEDAKRMKDIPKIRTFKEEEAVRKALTENNYALVFQNYAQSIEPDIKADILQEYIQKGTLASPNTPEIKEETDKRVQAKIDILRKNTKWIREYVDKKCKETVMNMLKEHQKAIAKDIKMLLDEKLNMTSTESSENSEPDNDEPETGGTDKSPLNNINGNNQLKPSNSKK